jgi:mannan polymerase complexes MNN9 subunit
VFWLDADIIETPQTIIQDLTRHNKDIVVANAYQRYTDDQGNPAIRPYDFNSWIDSEIARNLAKNMDENDVLFEGIPPLLFGGSRVLIAGYAEIPTYRTLMAYLYEPGQDAHEELSLDGVGTYTLTFGVFRLISRTALMVKAAVHRDGAAFPAFPFYHLLESEGFARMARRLGYACWGLPQYLVFLHPPFLLSSFADHFRYITTMNERF